MNLIEFKQWKSLNHELNTLAKECIRDYSTVYNIKKEPEDIHIESSNKEILIEWSYYINGEDLYGSITLPLNNFLRGISWISHFKHLKEEKEKEIEARKQKEILEKEEKYKKEKFNLYKKLKEEFENN